MKKILYISLILLCVQFIFTFSITEVNAEEEDDYILELTNYGINGFYSFGADAPADIFEESNGNQYLKLCNKGTSWSSFYFNSSKQISKNGYYRIQMDIRYDDDLNIDNFFIDLIDGNLNYRKSLNVPRIKDALDANTEAIENSDYRRFVFDFELTDYYSHYYKNVAIGFHNLGSESNNFDIDNINILYSEPLSFDEDVNIDDSVVGDFENFTNTIYQGDYEILAENGNNFLKIISKTAGAKVTKEISPTVNEARNYTLKLKVKAGNSFNGKLYFEIPNANISKTEIDLTAITSQWQTVSVDFKPTANTNKTSYLNFIFESANVNEDNYVLIDDIEIIRQNNNTNVDADYNGNLDGVVTNITKSGWTSDHSYYFLDADTENSIIMDGNNQVLKLYSENNSNTAVTKFMDVEALKNQGWYKLQFKAKGGKDLYIETLGFRLQSEDQGGGYHANEVTLDSSLIHSEDWVTIEAAFYVPKTSNSSWINLDIWYFGRNDLGEHRSVDNYLLIDDIKIFKAESDITYGDNTFSAGEISGFVKSQGRVDRGLLSLDSYQYSRELLSKNCLEQFNVGKKFNEISYEQHYFGTIELDVPAEIVTEDNYHAVLLTYDGKSVVKNYSTLTYLFHEFDFTIKNAYKVSFDYKVENESTDIIRFAFVSHDNEDDFMIDLYTAKLGENKTAGVNKDIYTYVITDNGDGWYHVELAFKPNVGFKSRVNSLRFIIAGRFNENNKLYVSNLELKEYSNEELPALPEVRMPSNDVAVERNFNWIYIAIGCGVLVLAGAAVTFVIIKKKRGGKNNG